jgi:hypothetical protein
VPPAPPTSTAATPPQVAFARVGASRLRLLTPVARRAGTHGVGIAGRDTAGASNLVGRLARHAVSLTSNLGVLLAMCLLGHLRLSAYLT